MNYQLAAELRRLGALLALVLALAPSLTRAATVTNPVVRSSALLGGKPAQKFTANITGWKTLVLAASGYSWGQAVWGEPVLIKADGSQTKLTDLKPASVQVGWGEFSVNHGPDHKQLKVAERQFAHGLFAHADSAVVYQLDGQFTRFESWVGINHTANNQGQVVFEVRDRDGLLWQQTADRLRRGFTRECLASLRRTLDQAEKSHAPPSKHTAALRQQLSAYERDFDGLRRALDANAESIRERLAPLQDLVRDIRLLKLDVPLLFVKRHPYFSPHIYDDYLTWHPGGGIYVIENPSAPMAQQIVRAVIDPQTKVTLGEGVYRDPDLSADGKRLLFAFKGEQDGSTSIYEIGLDGTGLRRLTNPIHDCPIKNPPAGLYGKGHHDVAPCYLPDGRIVFLSTRTGGLVLCFNNFIATLHTMNADGSDLKCISVNNVSEFDPTVLPDGRILFGRWEYVDKTALYMQSLWTVNPDGTQETALFKNNLAKPTAVLDARPVPDSDLIVASLTPHNGQSVGAIAMINPRVGKNNLAAIFNFTPEYPTEMDQGLARGPSDPWPLDEDSVLIANNAPLHGAHGVIELIDRFGFRSVIRREPGISCFSPTPVKPQPAPAVRQPLVQAGAPAKFFVHDIYQGLTGVNRGDVKQLRVLETTTRISGVPNGGRWWNQAFLVSWQGSYDVKNFLGVVPVEADGSACFEAPPGKALYFQALDKDHRLVQSMRTFVQAAPGVTRSCQGCHVPDDNAAPIPQDKAPLALQKPPAQIKPESWGKGFIDYPTMIQPVLDRNCVKCHGGEEGIAGGLDYSGGWTWAFSLSYETFLKNSLTGFLNCENGSVKTSEILPPRRHGSGAAPMAEQLIAGHHNRLREMPQTDIDLLLAWMDGNCNYYGTWDYSEHATCDAILPLRDKLLAAMDQTGCLRCHQKEIGNDWINLAAPEHSRVLRAPLAKDPRGLALSWCRDRTARPVHWPLITQKHQPPDVFRPAHLLQPKLEGKAVTTFANPDAPAYRALLAIIQQGREEALKKPRVDMPGAVVTRGKCRELPPLTPPQPSLALQPGAKPRSATPH